MAKTTFSACFALLTLCLIAAPAQAQLARTFVSSLGNDANDCQRLTPCRTFQGAHDKTLANGEVTVLDPGGYGAVTITKAISIINDGVGEAGMLVSGGLNGITINAGANDGVSLRGLTIKGLGSFFGGGNGIVFNSGKSLTVESCVIRNLTIAVDFAPNGSSNFAASNTLITDSITGTMVRATGAGTAHAVFDRLELYNNQAFGIVVTGAGTAAVVAAVVKDSVAANGANNGGFGIGFSAQSNAGPASLTVVRSSSANNNVGFHALGAAGTLRVGQSTITGNTSSWVALGGAILSSYGDNNIDGNGDGDPAPPTISKK